MKKILYVFLFTLSMRSALSTDWSEEDDIPMEGLEGDFSMEGLENKLSSEDVMNISVIASNSSTIFSNITHHGFFHGFGESISVILVSEIGDKTFFIAAILAMRNNKLTVFLGAVNALFLMTVLSGLLGWVVTTFIPREVTYYTCTAIMFLFGLKMLYEAWKMDDNQGDEVQREVEEELARRGSISSVNRQDVERAAASAASRTENTRDTSTETETTAEVSTVQETAETTPSGAGLNNPGFEGDATAKDNMDEIELSDANAPKADSETGPAATVPATSGDVVETPEEKAQKVKDNQKRRVQFLDNVIDRSCKENSWFGKKCLKIFKLFINTFTMTFIAEWGDRSQLATIVLVGFNDVGGVIVGGCLGHFICTGGAVLAGAIIARYVSVRKVTFIGALVFLGFAIASIFISPNEDGIDGIPEINGYDNATRLINHNVSLTLALQHLKVEEEMYGDISETSLYEDL